MPTKRYDNPLRYFVDSSTRNVQHLVELDAYNGVGKCTCEDFKFRCEPNLQSTVIDKSKWRCKHIREAREHLTDSIIERLAANQNLPPKENGDRVERIDGKTDKRDNATKPVSRKLQKARRK